MKRLSIIEEPNIIDDHFLDIIGNEFKFDHEKGLAEWLKNSVDAYIRAGTPDIDQHIIVRLKDGVHNDAILECIDFIGMEELDIEKAFKRWGDPEAAKRGLEKQVYGGHGNGGKFYMRQMFDRSHFITYKNNKINIFGFNEKKKYGFAEGFRNIKMKPKEALDLAGIDKLTLPKGLKEKVLSDKCGFTLVRGIGPANMKNKIKADKLIEKFKNHPQARRILVRINVWGTYNNGGLNLLRPDGIKPMSDFEEIRVIEIPRVLYTNEHGEKNVVETANKKYHPGRLILRTSEEAFGRGSRMADLNRIDIIGEIGVIASYSVSELGVITFPQASFIYGECECPILEDPEMDSVKNDRTKLVPNRRSRALLDWIRERIEEFAGDIVSKEKTEQEAIRKKISASYNEYLNRWKDKLMKRVLSEIFRSGFGTNGGGNGGNKGKILQIPEDGFSFTFKEAEIIKDESENLTLKAVVPKPIPVGGIISVISTNPLIESELLELVVRSENVKTAPTGEAVAVLNFNVFGRRVGEEGDIIALFGKRKTNISLRVIEGKGGNKTKKSKSPKVLLSGIDQDPLNIDPSGTVNLSERHPAIYQRHQDVAEGIYWINTMSSLAKSILDHYGDHATRWRDYLFQCYVDIFIKEALYELQKRDPEGFRAERIDSEILGTLISRIYNAAVDDLDKFFFEEEFEPLGSEDNSGNKI